MRPKRPAAVLPMVLGALTSGMMSSSCCLIQLLLNYTSIGCAGFSVLTAYRTHFRVLTGALLAALLVNNGINRRTMGACVAALALVCSQDALAVYNSGRLPPHLQQLLASLGLQPPPGPPPPAAIRYQLGVSGVRCEACASRIKGAVGGLPGVRNASVHFSEQQVEVWADGGATDGDQLQQAIQAAGYEAVLQQVACFDAAQQQQPCSKPQQQPAPQLDSSPGVTQEL